MSVSEVASQDTVTLVKQMTPLLFQYKTNLPSVSQSVTVNVKENAPATLRVFTLNPDNEKCGLTLYGPVKDIAPGKSGTWSLVFTTVTVKKNGQEKQEKVDPDIPHLKDYTGGVNIVAWWMLPEQQPLNSSENCDKWFTVHFQQ